MPKNKLIGFTTPTDPELSIIDGRNGCYPIQKLYIWESHDHRHVYIDGIGKRAVSIKGGFRVTLECFANACRQFLDEYGKQIREQNAGRKHTDNCGRTGAAAIASCALNCGCWCHEPIDCLIDTEGFCQTCKKVHLRERAADMGVPIGETYPREDKCSKCGVLIGWIMSEAGEAVALGLCEDCKRGDHDV